MVIDVFRRKESFFFKSAKGKCQGRTNCTSSQLQAWGPFRLHMHALSSFYKHARIQILFSRGRNPKHIFFYCSWGSKALHVFSVIWPCAFFQGVDLLFIYIYYVKNSAKLSEEGDGVLRRYKVDMVLRVLLWQSPNTCM